MQLGNRLFSAVESVGTGPDPSSADMTEHLHADTYAVLYFTQCL